MCLQYDKFSLFSLGHPITVPGAGMFCGFCCWACCCLLRDLLDELEMTTCLLCGAGSGTTQPTTRPRRLSPTLRQLLQSTSSRPFAFSLISRIWLADTSHTERIRQLFTFFPHFFH